MNLITKYTNLVSRQHADKVKFLQVAGVICQPYVDQQNLAERLLYDLDQASGTQLDALAALVGAQRQVQVLLTGIYFELDSPGNGFDQGVWKAPGDATFGSLTLQDPEYRLLIQARILNNHWNGSIYDAYSLMNSALSSFGYFISIMDNCDLTMDLALQGGPIGPDNLIWSLFTTGYFDIRPATVSIIHYRYGIPWAVSLNPATAAEASVSASIVTFGGVSEGGAIEAQSLGFSSPSVIGTAGVGGGDVLKAYTGVPTALTPLSMGASNTYSVAISPDGLSVYTSRASGLIEQYSRNPITGLLTSLGSPTRVSTNYGPLIFSPDGLWAYSKGFGSTVDIYSRGPATGLLTWMSAFVSSDTNFGGMVISPDGLNLYVAEISTGLVQQLSRNQSTGLLTSLGSVSSGNTDQASLIGIHPSGKWVYRFGRTTGFSGEQFTRDPLTGLLTLTAAAISLGGSGVAGLIPSYPVFLPHSVYVPGNSNETFCILINPSTGALTMGVRLSGSMSAGLAVSKDGANLYQTAYLIAGSIGQIKKLQLLSTGLPASGWAVYNPLTGVSSQGHSMVLSPDGEHLYVSEYGGSANGLFQFKRN